MSTGLGSFLADRFADDQADIERGEEWPLWAIQPSRLAARVRRALDDLDAKRRIAAMHHRRVVGGRSVCAGCGTQGVGPVAFHIELDRCPTLRLLASPYSSHPDYDERWRP